jgi:hypothetical protein
LKERLVIQRNRKVSPVLHSFHPRALGRIRGPDVDLRIDDEDVAVSVLLFLCKAPPLSIMAGAAPEIPRASI